MGGETNHRQEQQRTGRNRDGHRQLGKAGMRNNNASDCSGNAAGDRQSAQPSGKTPVDQHRCAKERRRQPEQQARHTREADFDLPDSKRGMEQASLSPFRCGGPSVRHCLEGYAIDGLQRGGDSQACDRACRSHCRHGLGGANCKQAAEEHERPHHQGDPKELHQMTGDPMTIRRVFGKCCQRYIWVSIHRMKICAGKQQQGAADRNNCKYPVAEFVVHLSVPPLQRRS